MRNKQHFKDVARLAELRARSAEQAHNPEEAPTDPFAESMISGLKYHKEEEGQPTRAGHELGC